MSEPCRGSERTQAIVIPLLSVGLALFLVELTKRGGLLPITVPAPSQVAMSFAREYDTILYHLLPTLQSAAIGFAVAVVVALALAAVATLFKPAKSPIYNIAVVTYSIPLLALSPVLVVWLGQWAGGAHHHRGPGRLFSGDRRRHPGAGCHRPPAEGAVRRAVGEPPAALLVPVGAVVAALPVLRPEDFGGQRRAGRHRGGMGPVPSAGWA